MADNELRRGEKVGKADFRGADSQSSARSDRPRRHFEILYSG